MSYAIHLFMFNVIVRSHVGIQTLQFLPDHNIAVTQFCPACHIGEQHMM